VVAFIRVRAATNAVVCDQLNLHRDDEAWFDASSPTRNTSPSPIAFNSIEGVTMKVQGISDRSSLIPDLKNDRESLIGDSHSRHP